MFRLSGADSPWQPFGSLPWSWRSFTGSGLPDGTGSESPSVGKTNRESGVIGPAGGTNETPGDGLDGFLVKIHRSRRCCIPGGSREFYCAGLRISVRRAPAA